MPPTLALKLLFPKKSSLPDHSSVSVCNHFCEFALSFFSVSESTVFSVHTGLAKEGLGSTLGAVSCPSPKVTMKKVLFLTRLGALFGGLKTEKTSSGTDFFELNCLK